METRVAVMSIIVEDADAAEKINAILHEYGEYSFICFIATSCSILTKSSFLLFRVE